MAKILVASEDQLLQDGMVATIEAEEYEAIPANNGLDVQEIALREQPHLILLEAKLSIFNGFETALALREDPDIDPNVPIVLITDETVDPHKIDHYGITEVFPRTHGSLDLRDMMIRLLGDHAGD